MSNKRISMRKIREIIRLYTEVKLSHRKISKALNISRPVISQYIRDFKATGLRYADIKEMSDSKLINLLGGKRKIKNKRYAQLSSYFQYFARELKKTGVTLYLLWEEYRRKHSYGYSYTQFCYHYQVWRTQSEVTMHLDHKAGDKMFVDFAGKKIEIIDRKTGAVKPVEVFAAILGASQLTYAEAVKSQKKEDWIKANENAIRYFGGVPCAVIPDNLKSGVKDSNKYEPDINPEYADFSRHYGTVIIPARPGRPKDKALVENAVHLIYMRIYAQLRHRTFNSLKDLNESMRELLDKHNNMLFQRLQTSRYELFKSIEKQELKPLPATRYEFKKFHSLKVQINYHIEIREDRHYYSVPHRYKGKRVIVQYTDSTVEIYYDNERVAFHKRSRKPGGYTTNKEHMPPHHRFYDSWSPQRFINWAEHIGPYVKTMIINILEHRAHPEQAFKACLGILHLAKKFSDERLDNACGRALRFRCYSYKSIKNILMNGLDKISEENYITPNIMLPEHENIRGSKYYN